MGIPTILKQGVVVTGASGFIGRELCKSLLVGNWQVRGIVRPSSNCHTLPPEVDVIPLEEKIPLRSFEKALSGVDTVVHLAGRADGAINHSEGPWSECGYVGPAGTQRFAGMASACGVRRFVYLSSIKVNGEGGAVAYREEDEPEPLDAYGMTKWESEKALHAIGDETGLEVVIIRSPLVYGPGVKANFLRLIETIERGIPLPLAGIHNRRSFIYLGNLTDAIVRCMTHPIAAGRTFLVSDGEDVSTPELIRRISSALGKPARLFLFPPFLLRMAGIVTGRSFGLDSLMQSLTIDCSKIRRELDWRVPFTMDEGLRETARWYLRSRDIRV